MREKMQRTGMKSLVIGLGLLAIHLISWGQMPDGARNFAPQPGRLYGKVTDSKTKKGVEAVSIQLMAASKDSLIGGMLTLPNGDFNFENIPTNDSIHVLISAIGTKEHSITVFFGDGKGLVRDLGNIKIEQDGELLDAVTVSALKSALQMGIDRKVFNADKALIAVGGTASDIMKGIPSVSVDVDGNVLLRNSSPQIFVDGRPTILTLDQIPADNIERVELITNPSAKFDAASTGGIINIVLKKSKKAGMNGMASLGLGLPEQLNANLNLNYKQGKFNLFAVGAYNKSTGEAKGSTYRENKRDYVIQDYFIQKSLNDRNNLFQTYRFGADYFIDNRNTLSLTQNITKGKFDNNETQEQMFHAQTGQALYAGNRLSESGVKFTNLSTQLAYKHNFAKPGKEVTADLTYNNGTGRNHSNIFNSFFAAYGSPDKDPNRVRNSGNNSSDQWTVQVDYVNPVSEDGKIEMGARSFRNNFSSVYDAFSVATDGAETKLPLSNNYEYIENINALYFTYSNKWNNISYQAGLRAEHSKFDGKLVDKGDEFGYEYPSKAKDLFNAFFPSLYLTKEVGDGNQVQLNYSRRIRRPDFHRLNPFIDINDPVNLRQGNPALRPEFTNNIEFNYNKTYSTGNFLAVAYYKNTQGDMTQYSDTISAAQYAQLNNAAIDPNAILNTFINAQHTNRLGAEFTLQQKVGKFFDFTPTFNVEYRNVKALVGDLNLSNEGVNWNSKLTLNYRSPLVQSVIFKNMSVQAIGNYESPEVIPQGKRKEQYHVDLALRKDLLKNNRGTLTFAVNDVFDTRRFGMVYDTESFYQDFYRRRNVRNFKLTFAYKFGKSDMNLFKKPGKKPQNDDDDDEMM